MVYKNTPEADPNEAYKLRGAVPGNRKVMPGKINPNRNDDPITRPGPKRGVPEGASGKQPYTPGDTKRGVPANERYRKVGPRNPNRSTPGTIRRPTPSGPPVANKPLPNPPGPDDRLTKPGGIRPGGMKTPGSKPAGNFVKRPEFNRQQQDEQDPNKKAALRRLQKRRYRKGYLNGN